MRVGIVAGVFSLVLGVLERQKQDVCGYVRIVSERRVESCLMLSVIAECIREERYLVSGIAFTFER